MIRGEGSPVIEDVESGTLTLPDEGWEIGPMRSEEVRELARLHHRFFSGAGGRGRTLARLGADFLERVFYGLNLDNPYFFVDVARCRGEIVAFSVYASDGKQVFRETLRRHGWRVAAFLLPRLLRAPGLVVGDILGNLRSLFTALPEAVGDVRGWYFLLAVKPEFRSREFKQRTGVWLTELFWQQMELTLRRQGCDSFWAFVAEDHAATNRLFERHGTERVAQGIAQGVPGYFYRKSLKPVSSEKE